MKNGKSNEFKTYTSTEIELIFEKVHMFLLTLNMIISHLFFIIISLAKIFILK